MSARSKVGLAGGQPVLHVRHKKPGAMAGTMTHSVTYRILSTLLYSAQ
jgi:hypothetical protein